MRKETIVIVYQPRRNRDGDVIGEAAPDDVVTGCKIWPRTNEEGEIIVEGLNVFIPDGKPVPRGVDLVRARGETWEVIATPGEFIGKGALMTLQKAGISSAAG